MEDGEEIAFLIGAEQREEQRHGELKSSLTVEEKDSSKLLPTDPEWKWGPVRGDSQKETDILVLYGDSQFSSVCSDLCKSSYRANKTHL